jgi:ABC-type transport system involved in cytochrome bd biosynthesis fused ATPase/permease subunit
MALLGELHYTPSGLDSWFNLPRENGVAYAAQESWVQNETIRDNILFGAEFDETRYRKVVHQCGLGQDLALFEGGDKTEVGEKGLTLSGGQKARVTLARAVYSQAQVLILDDILAALDVHTAKWIVEKCLQGDLVCGRTVLLVVRSRVRPRILHLNATLADPQHRLSRTRGRFCCFAWARWPDPKPGDTLGGPKIKQGTSQRSQGSRTESR